MAAHFFDIYKTEGGSDSAVSYFFATNKYAMTLRPKPETLKARLRQHIDVLGQYHGYDLLAKKSAGPNYILYVYLVRHDREPLTFRMLFYKPADKWKIQTFNYPVLSAYAAEIYPTKKMIAMAANSRGTAPINAVIAIDGGG